MSSSVSHQNCFHQNDPFQYFASFSTWRNVAYFCFWYILGDVLSPIGFTKPTLRPAIAVLLGDYSTPFKKAQREMAAKNFSFLFKAKKESSRNKVAAFWTGKAPEKSSKDSILK